MILLWVYKVFRPLYGVRTVVFMNECRVIYYTIFHSLSINNIKRVCSLVPVALGAVALRREIAWLMKTRQPVGFPSSLDTIQIVLV